MQLEVEEKKNDVSACTRKTISMRSTGNHYFTRNTNPKCNF